MMNGSFSATVTINSYPDQVWATLTDLKLMTQWLGEPEMNVEAETNWEINSPIFIRGFHHLNFENKGIILRYDKEHVLSYTQLSSVSRLEDRAENYTTLEFVLTPSDKQTVLTINLENFPTETIQKHLEFYWRTTILNIKQVAEKIPTNA